jgi:D-glycero-D-manno-heptose 1,7-bisphosphate phosphatase
MTTTRHPALFLDRDGTLIDDVGCLASPADVVLLPGVVEALRLLQPWFRFVLITNQPWIGWGKLTAAQAEAVNAEVARQLAAAGISLLGSYYCPHPRDQGCSCIKPHPTLARQAAEDHGLDIAASWVIGDHPHDIRMVETLGARGGVYVLTGHGAQHAEQAREAGMTIVPDLLAAAHHILGSACNK